MAKNDLIQKDIDAIIKSGGSDKDVFKYLKSQGVSYSVPSSPEEPNTVSAKEQGYKMAIERNMPVLGKVLNKYLSPEQQMTGAEVIGGFTPASPLIVGAGEFSKSQYRGEPKLESLRKGVVAGGIDAALLFTGAKIAKGIARAVPMIAKGRIAKEVINRAVEKPEILQGEIKTIDQSGDELTKLLKSFRETISTKYEQGVNSLPIKEGIVGTSNIRKAMTKENIQNPDFLASLIKANPLTKLKAIPDNAIERLVGISRGKLTAKEAKELNSVLGRMVNDSSNSQIARELNAIRKPLASGLEKSIPGMEDVNKEYARGKTLLENITKRVTESGWKYEDGLEKMPIVKAEAVRKIALQLLDKPSNRVQEAKWLFELQERTGHPIVEVLKDSVARESIERGGQSASNTIAELAGLAGIWGGGTYGGGLGAVGGYLGAKKLAQSVGSPNLIKGAIGLGRGMVKYGNVVSPARIGLEQLMLNGGNR